MKTLAQRIMTKSINTMVLTRFWRNIHKLQYIAMGLMSILMRLCEKTPKLVYPGLFTIDLEGVPVSSDAFRRFFDALEPRFSHQVSIGQSNTLILCPALTSHSELDSSALADSGIHQTTMRIAVGTDNVKGLIAQFITAARLHYRLKSLNLMLDSRALMRLMRWCSPLASRQLEITSTACQRCHKC